jgi:hypothetical protein
MTLTEILSLAAEMCSCEVNAMAPLKKMTRPWEKRLAIIRKLQQAESFSAVVLKFPGDSELEKEFAAARERACRVCGCTQGNACRGGCWWVEFDLCSACVETKVKAASCHRTPKPAARKK